MYFILPKTHYYQHNVFRFIFSIIIDDLQWGLIGDLKGI